MLPIEHNISVEERDAASLLLSSLRSAQYSLHNWNFDVGFSGGGCLLFSLERMLCIVFLFVRRCV